MNLFWGIDNKCCKIILLSANTASVVQWFYVSIVHLVIRELNLVSPILQSFSWQQ